jgi:phospholipase C
VFDHTSQLKFLHARFGIEVPNVSRWRRRTVGNLTSTLFRSPHKTKLPDLPHVPLTPFSLGGNCMEVTEEAEFIGGAGPTLRHKQRMPTQRDDRR